MTKLPIEIDNFRKLRVEYHLVDSCNLNCKACSHYSNLKSTKKEIPKTLDKIEKDFRKIWELTNSGDPKYVDKITLMGGEPLLYKNIIPAIDLVKSLFPHNYNEGPVNLITNGILLPRMKPDFFECLRRNKIRVCVSMYNHDYTGKKIEYDSFFKILDEERIDWYWYTVNTLEDKQFHTKWLHTNFDENYKEYAQDCYWRQSCTQLVDNKVYLCPLIAYWKYFDAEFEGQHNFVITDEDSIDLDKINSFEELQVERDKVPHFCGYCKGHNAVSDEWGITTRTIDEYVDDKIYEKNKDGIYKYRGKKYE